MNRLTMLLCGIASLVATGQSAFAQPVERPVLKPGTEWSYKIDNSKRDKPGPPGELKRVVKDHDIRSLRDRLSDAARAIRRHNHRDIRVQSLMDESFVAAIAS